MTKTKMTLREIDAAVAQHVMGWVVPEGSEYFHTTSGDVHPNDWMPSSNFADAWRVVEDVQRLHDSEIGFQLSTGPGIILNGVMGEAEARFFYAGWQAWDIRAVAATPQIAICVAALSAHGIDVDPS